MQDRREVLNNLLVILFNNILSIEEKALQTGDFKDLSISELHVIEAARLECPPTMTRIANRLGVTVGTLTIAINNLVRKTYVKRVKDEHDRRIVNIELTDKGLAAFKHHETFHDEMIAFTIEALSDEESGILVEALSKLTLYFENKYGTDA